MASRRPRTTPQPVALVGTGPGNPDLLTVRATRMLADADVVLAGPDVPPAVLEGLAAEVVPVTAEVDAVKDAVVRAREGQRVVRAYAGDPLGAPVAVREAEGLGKAGVPFTVVPGVPVPVAVGDYAGVPLACPYTVAALSGAADGRREEPDWAALATAAGTLVLELGSPGDVAKAAGALVEHGRRADTPVSVTVDGTTTAQRTVVSTLERVEADVAVLPSAPAVAVVGNAVRARDKLSWWETRALYGWTVLVPRTREQAGTLSDLLRSHGATPLEVPTIAVEPPRSPAPMERALKGLVSGRYQWVAFTSTNAVRAVRERVEEYGLDARAFAGVKVAAVGEVTAAALEAWGIRPDVVPSGQQSSEGLLADWPPFDEVLDPIDRVLLPRADIATETLVAGLKERGWTVDDVTAYRTVRAAPPPAPIREALKGGGVDAVLFTSSSTVRNLVGIAGKPHESTVIAAIGPQTAEAAREMGLRVDVESAEPSVPALVQALATFALERREAEAKALAEGAPMPGPGRGKPRRKR